MPSGTKLIERYILRAVTPYLLLSLVLLTAILFAQQASRFAEILMGTRVPLRTVGELAVSVLPNVLSFTLPMALISGILIGFSRMGSDSELTAMRAAGVGTLRMLWPALLIGLLLALASLYVNLKMAPESARLLRRIGERTIFYKLDSPVEPRAFNTDIPRKVIYVRDGDKTEGKWGRVFLYAEQKDGSTSIVTARSGRIDAAGDQSELVMSDAVKITLPGHSTEGQPSYVTERLDQLRVALDTGRKSIMESLHRSETETKPNEMEWGELSAYADTKSGVERREALTLLHKRLAMSFAPLLFAFVGATLGLRVRKGGRAIGVLLSVLVILAYYLITLAGEQMARAGTIAPFIGAWLASAATLGYGIVLLLRDRVGLLGRIRSVWEGSGETAATRASRKSSIQSAKTRLSNFPSLLDLDILRSTTSTFALAFAFLVAIFLLFTVFELWRLIVAKGIGFWTVGEYLLFLLPLATVQLLPASVLIAVLAAYALKSRRSEAIAWWASGQSIYRLMLPGLIFAAILGGFLWVIQEQIMPQANIRQDTLRTQIRGEVSRATASFDKQWLASAESGRIYSYEYEQPGRLKNPVVYEFDGEGIHLQRIIKGQEADWPSPGRLIVHQAESLGFGASGVQRETLELAELDGVEPIEVFRPVADKPSHLTAAALRDYITTISRQGGDVAPLSVALQKKYADPFSPLVIAMTGIPLALAFGRKSAILALCLAIGLGLLFWAASGGFRQMGEYGLLPPVVAAWSPIVIFAAIGVFLLARSNT
ncbi:MAG: lipopolysaccharide export system permease protein lptG [Acidobacteriota bacterium]|jgi:LPS export ABC transporter permease LptF/LPS export ABC transporter permease LptG|nr:lipopolysaccharide export system permease protein lptG [Acidobacteriota bacterium]